MLMDRATIPATHLRLKGLIWLHSLLGTLFGMAFFWVVLTQQRAAVILPLAACLGPWIAGLGPIAKRASALASESWVPPRGLPGWVLVLWAVGEMFSLYNWGFSDWLPLLLWAHALLGGTIFLRGALSSAMGVPIHGRTWWASLSIVGLVLCCQLFCGWMLAVASC